MEASDLHAPLDGTAQIAVELRRRCRNFRNKYHDAYVEDGETPKSMEREKRCVNAVPPLVERWLELSEDEKIRIFESARSQVSQEAHKQSQDRLYVTQLLHAACPELENQDICKEFQGKGVVEIVERLLEGVEDDGYLESSTMLERRTKKFLKWIESRGASDSTETNKKMLIIFRNYFLCCFSVALLREFYPALVRGNNE